MSYQGWRNYETWAMALWIDNDEPLYRESRDMARDARAEGGKKRYDVYRFANELKDWMGELQPDLGASVWSDLLTSAFGEVDWQEIAEGYLAEVAESETA